jgi:hypothetical protein
MRLRQRAPITLAQEATGTTARLSPPPKYVKNTETLLFRCEQHHTQCRMVEVLIELIEGF